MPDPVIPGLPVAPANPILVDYDAMLENFARSGVLQKMIQEGSNYFLVTYLSPLTGQPIAKRTYNKFAPRATY